MYNERSKKLMLGEGETIGHKHLLQSERHIEFERNDENLHFQINDLGILTHDEHDRMVFYTGKFRRYLQVELNPLDNTISSIFD